MGASQAPWRLPALHPLIFEGDKENRDKGFRPPENKVAERRSVG